MFPPFELYNYGYSLHSQVTTDLFLIYDDAVFLVFSGNLLTEFFRAHSSLTQSLLFLFFFLYLTFFIYFVSAKITILSNISGSMHYELALSFIPGYDCMKQGASVVARTVSGRYVDKDGKVVYTDRPLYRAVILRTEDGAAEGP